MDDSEIGLPRPAPQAAAISRELTERIAAAIGAAGGWIGFDRYMTMALYEPGLGYYSNGKPVFGPVGDFVTAPELTPLFGAAVSRQVGSWLAACCADDPLVIEFGAGSGALASQLLNSLERQGFPKLRYRILELSGDLRRLQQQTIAARAPQAAGQVEWLEAAPAAFTGVAIANSSRPSVAAARSRARLTRCDASREPTASTNAVTAQSDSRYSTGTRSSSCS